MCQGPSDGTLDPATPDRPRLHVLLELWLEPREIVGAPRLVRGRARNLLTGRRRPVTSPLQLSQFIDGELDELDPAPRVWEGEGP